MWGLGHREGKGFGRASGKRSRLRVCGSPLELACTLLNLSPSLALPPPPSRLTQTGHLSRSVGQQRSQRAREIVAFCFSATETKRSFQTILGLVVKLKIIPSLSLQSITVKKDKYFQILLAYLRSQTSRSHAPGLSFYCWLKRRSGQATVARGRVFVAAAQGNLLEPRPRVR